MSTYRASNILVTASVSTLRLNVGDVEVCVDQLLVEHSETRDSVDVSYALWYPESRHWPLINEVGDYANFLPSATLDPGGHIKLYR